MSKFLKRDEQELERIFFWMCDPEMSNAKIAKKLKLKSVHGLGYRIISLLRKREMAKRAEG